jgi:hypothetical protein
MTWEAIAAAIRGCIWVAGAFLAGHVVRTWWEGGDNGFDDEE